MIVPNKAVPYESSILSKLPLILHLLSTGTTSSTELYHKMHGSFEDINQFLLAMDILFLLGKIKFTDGDLILC